MKKLLLAGAVIAAPLAAQTDAQIEARYSREYFRCINSISGSTTYGMQLCVDNEYGRQDAILNTTYRKALARLSKAQQAKLRDAQRAWIKQRDEKAQAEADEWNGGTGATAAYTGALLRETVRRSIWLEKYR